jgi:hypothetical protein
MSANVPAASAAPHSTPSASDPTTAAAAVSSGQPTTMTTVASMASLRQQAPQLYKQMMMSFASTICQDMQNASNHLVQMMQEEERENS